MSSPDDASDLSPSQKLAALVAKRKAAGPAQNGALPGRRSTERAAAASSASKSKPAPRKG